MNLIHEHIDNGFLYSTDTAKLDLKYVHGFLGSTYWAKGIPFDIVARSVENSLSFGIYEGTRQVGFARLVTDYATFGYLADVFIDEAYRGKGLSKKLMTFIFSLEELKFFRRMILATRDAHGLYAQHGFKPLRSPEVFMERHQPDVYKSLA